VGEWRDRPRRAERAWQARRGLGGPSRLPRGWTAVRAGRRGGRARPPWLTWSSPTVPVSAGAPQAPPRRPAALPPARGHSPLPGRLGLRDRRSPRAAAHSLNPTSPTGRPLPQHDIHDGSNLTRASSGVPTSSRHVLPPLDPLRSTAENDGLRPGAHMRAERAGPWTPAEPGPQRQPPAGRGRPRARRRPAAPTCAQGARGAEPPALAASGAPTPRPPRIEDGIEQRPPGGDAGRLRSVELSGVAQPRRGRWRLERR
jgi:hypothetical protein